jgi:dephospho-CoA kinase
MNEKILVLVGMPGAGKSLCVDYLTAMGMPSVYFGGLIIDEVKRRGLEVNEPNERSVREEIRAKEGKGAYATRILIKIDKLLAEGHKNIVADGLYSWSEYKIFKDRFDGDAVMIAIAAPRHMRHQRLANRPVRPFSEAEATSREYAEIEQSEKGGPIANADYTIINDSTQEHLFGQLDKVLKEVGINPETK